MNLNEDEKTVKNSFSLEFFRVFFIGFFSDSIVTMSVGLSFVVSSGAPLAKPFLEIFSLIGATVSCTRYFWSFYTLFGQRTRRERCPRGQRGEFSIRPSERTSVRANERPSGRPLRVQPSALSRPQPPRPLDHPQAPAPLFQASSHSLSPCPLAPSPLREPLPPTD